MNKKKEANKRVKIDKKSMREADRYFIIIIIILFILLSVAMVTIINPDMINNIKASIQNLFN